MNIRIVCAIGVCMCFGKNFSQFKTMNGLLDEIAQNNTELDAYRSYMEGQQLKNRSDNNLPDLQVLGYYLPFGEHQSGDYSEFEVSQSFEFPTVYTARSRWNNLKAIQLETSYAKKRQEVLLKAKEGLINLYVLQKQKSMETQRRFQSKKVYEQTQELFEKEQIGILDLNKAKVAWLQEQFVLDRLNVDINNQITDLQTLNGGQPLEVEQLQLDNPTQLETMEAIWNEKLGNDPRLLELLTNEATSLQYVALEKNKVLPNITLGYNYQGIMGDNFSGVYGGLSIPLWNSRNKVKAAKADYEYQKSSTQTAKAVLYTQFQQDYNQYQLLFDKYNEYKNTMAHLNSEELLFKAYKLGEFSFLEYNTEVQFYRNAMDEMLQMKRQLQLLEAQLLIHQL